MVSIIKIQKTQVKHYKSTNLLLLHQCTEHTPAESLELKISVQ